MLLDRIEPASETADILIVGAGAVGLTMGIALARAGKRVLLCEAARQGSTPNGKPITTWFRAVGIIWDRLMAVIEVSGGQPGFGAVS